MADAPVVHIGENSPEQVAFKLMEIIANHEDKVLRGSTSGPTKKADRKWILDTYAECLATVRNPGTHLKSSKE
jgi:hypothetical protein